MVMRELSWLASLDFISLSFEDIAGPRDVEGERQEVKETTSQPLN